jgi:hypothetical protein
MNGTKRWRNTLKGFHEPTIVHYGGYEATFLKQLGKRFSGRREDSQEMSSLRYSTICIFPSTRTVSRALRGAWDILEKTRKCQAPYL